MKTKTINRSIPAGLAAMPPLSLTDETLRPGNMPEGVSSGTPCNDDQALVHERLYHLDSARFNFSATYVKDFSSSPSAHPQIMHPRNLFSPEKLLRRMQQTQRRTLTRLLTARGAH